MIPAARNSTPGIRHPGKGSLLPPLLAVVYHDIELCYGVYVTEGRSVGTKRFVLNAARTAKQGQHINIGKEYAEYTAIVTTLTMHPADMKALGIATGARVRVRTEHGEATFRCEEGKVPEGMLFVPYGPPTCQLMSGDTDGTGMPTSRGWEVDVEPIESED